MCDCAFCEVESDCAYEYKPCDCVGQRKFKRKEPILKIYATEEEWMALVDKLGELRELINQKNQALNGTLEMIDSVKYPVVWKFVHDAFMQVEK